MAWRYQAAYDGDVVALADMLEDMFYLYLPCTLSDERFQVHSVVSQMTGGEIATPDTVHIRKICTVTESLLSFRMKRLTFAAKTTTCSRDLCLTRRFWSSGMDQA